jgi:AcrR family transcriptional regulator
MPKSDSGQSAAPRARHSLTPKGVRTRKALLESGRKVFEAEGFFAASVSEIGRQCGVSQGTFYQYFKNKEQIFREIIDLVLSDFWSRARKFNAEKTEFDETFRNVLGLILRHCREYATLHRVLNEFELIETITISYFDSIARFYRGFFRRATLQGHTKLLDPNLIAYSLLGVATFLQRSWETAGGRYTDQDLVDLTADFLGWGISGSKAWKAPRRLVLLNPSAHQAGRLKWEESGAPGKITRRAIFQAAERVFGEFGYSRASISEITRRAGVAQGTFYVHFKSKEDLLYGVVKFLSRELRRELSHATDRVQDKRDKEIQGMLAFFNFLGLHSPIYRIVSESEVIVPESAQYYYEKLAAGYTVSLSDGIKKGEIRNLPIDMVVPALMGINHMIGLRWLVWNSSSHPEVPLQIAADAIELILNGLRIRP